MISYAKIIQLECLFFKIQILTVQYYFGDALPIPKSYFYFLLNLLE